MNLIASQKSAFQHFADCAEQAPKGAYEPAKALREIIGIAVDGLIQNLRALGLKVDNCDGAFAVEAAIYDWLKASNPDSTLFPTAEGFGAAMAGPARERVLADARHSVAIFGQDDSAAAAGTETMPKAGCASRSRHAHAQVPSAFSTLAGALWLAIRQVDYLAGGDPERFSTPDVIAGGWQVLETNTGTQEAPLREPLYRALRVLEAYDRDTPLPEPESKVVDAGLKVLLEVGYSPEQVCEDSQFDRGALPGMGGA